MPSTAEIALSLIFYHCARNFKSENFGSAKIQTQDGWVRSPNSTSVLCSPPKDFHCFGPKLANVKKRKKMENLAVLLNKTYPTKKFAKNQRKLDIIAAELV